MTPRGPYVIEVNDFPTYSAVPDAGAAIAQHVLALTDQHRRAGDGPRADALDSEKSVVNPAPRIHFLLVRRTPPGLGPVLAEVYERLQAQGVAVDDHIPEDQLLSYEELVVTHDLYVLKSHTELALSTAGTLCALGARLLNPHRSCLLTQDKITSTKLLSDAGVPVPCSWVTDDYGLLVPLLAEGPLIAKPHRGHLGKGIRILRSAEDLDLLSPAEGPFLFQRYLETDSEDIKTYVVGREPSPSPNGSRPTLTRFTATQSSWTRGRATLSSSAERS